MQIDINYARAYIYHLLCTSTTNKKYPTVSKKTIDIIINDLKDYFYEKENRNLNFYKDETVEDNFNQVFYSDDEEIILKKKLTVDLSVFLLCSKAKAVKDGDLIEITDFDQIVENYFSSNSNFINQLIEYDDRKVDKNISRLKEYYRYIQNTYRAYFMSNDQIMHQRYMLAEIVKKRNKLLDKLSKDSVVFEEFQKLESKEDISFLDDDFYKYRLKEDSALYNIKNNSRSKNNRQVSKPEFLLYVDNIYQKKYHDNISELLTGDILDDYPNEKKYIEIQSISNSIISENLFFYTDEEWLDQDKMFNCNHVNPVVIYEIWKNALSNEIKSILSISDDEYRNNKTLFAKKLNTTMIIKSFADLSPNICDKINQYLSEIPEFYHSSHKIGRSLLRDFSNFGGNYDKTIKKMITKD